MANYRKEFSKIYDKCIDKIYRFIFLKVNSQEIAQDLTSETFLKGWEAFRKSQNPGHNDQKVEEDKSSSSPTEALDEVKKRTKFSSPVANARVVDELRSSPPLANARVVDELRSSPPLANARVVDELRSSPPLANARVIENPQAFLYQIARNLVIDHYREKGKAQLVSVEYIPIIDPKQDLEEKSLLESDIGQVQLALTGLKEDYQNVIIWHYLDDLPIREVAKMLDRTEETTRVLLHRALKSLKDEINKREVKEG